MILRVKDSNGNWVDIPSIVGPKGDTGATGPQGPQGEIGPAGADGAQGSAGADGVTPHIGDNGNWYLVETDTGKPSRGETGPAGADGRDGADGQPGADGKSAYQYAVEGGYTGTEAEFAAKLAQEKYANPNSLTFTGAVTGSYDGSAPLSVNIPQGGGGGSEKELTLLADINFEGNTASTFEYTGLDDVSEIYIVGGEIKSELDTAEAKFSLAINDIAIATSSVLTIQKKSGTDTWNRYHILRFNGAFWESLRSPDHAGASTISHSNSANYPNSVVLDVGKAKKLKLHVPNPAYKPVTGWMKIWVR